MEKVIALFESLEHFFNFCWQAFNLLMDLNYVFIIGLYDLACSLINFASKIHEFPFIIYSTALGFSKQLLPFLVESFSEFHVNSATALQICYKFAFVHDFTEFDTDFQTLCKSNLKILPVIMIAAWTWHGLRKIYSYLYLRFESVRVIVSDFMEEYRLIYDAQIEPRTRRVRQRRQRRLNTEPRVPEVQQPEEPHTSREEQASVSPINRSYLCCVCLEKNSEIVLMPCNHLCICESCLRQSRAQAQMRVCPICRQSVKKEIKIFA
jgi:hypothetical protein